MATSYASRLGTAPEEAVKAPCVVATTANITLSGEQTIGSVAVVAGDRVGVILQTDATENGIYVAAASAWSRASDWNDAQDVVNGQLISVPGALHEAVFTGSFAPGTTSVSFTAVSQLPNNKAVYEYTTSILTNSHPNATTGYIFETTYYDINKAIKGGATWQYTGSDDVSKAGTKDADGFVYDSDGKQCKNITLLRYIEQWGAIGDGIEDEPTDDYAAILAAITAGGDIYGDAKTYSFETEIDWPSDVHFIGQGRDSTILSFDGTRANEPLMTVAARNNVWLRGFKLDCQSANGTIATSTRAAGIALKQVPTNCRIDDVWIYDAGRHALVIDTGEQIDIEDLRISSGCVSSAILCGQNQLSNGWGASGTLKNISFENILITDVLSDAFGVWNVSGIDSDQVSARINVDNLIVRNWGIAGGIGYAWWTGGASGTYPVDVNLNNFNFDNGGAGSTNQGRGFHLEVGDGINASNGNISNLITGADAPVSDEKLGYAISLSGGNRINMSNITIRNVGIGVLTQGSSNVNFDNIHVNTCRYQAFYICSNDLTFTNCTGRQDGSVSSTQSAWGFYSSTSNLTGAVVTAASTSVTGVDTLFDTELAVGDWIKVGSAQREIATITDATNMTVTASFAGGEDTTALTGSINPTASTAVVGDGTLFTSELSVGNWILVSAEVRKIATITDNTNLTVTSAFSDNANDTSPVVYVTALEYTLRPENIIVDHCEGAVHSAPGDAYGFDCVGPHIKSIRFSNLKSGNSYLMNTRADGVEHPFLHGDLMTIKLKDSVGASTDYDFPVLNIPRQGFNKAFIVNAYLSFDTAIAQDGTDLNYYDLQIRDSAGANPRSMTATLLTGSIDPAASTTVTGVGTEFDAELAVGQVLFVSEERRIVDGQTTDTAATVSAAFSNNANDTAPKVLTDILDTNNEDWSTPYVSVPFRFDDWQLCSVNAGETLSLVKIHGGAGQAESGGVLTLEYISW